MDDQAPVFLGNPALETERLLLRRLSLEDAEAVYAYASDPEVTRFLLWPTHGSLDDSRAFLQATLDRYARDECGEWGIALKETGRLIGTIGIVQAHPARGWCEIGYVVGRPHWRLGYAPEAVRRVIRFAFEDMHLNRVEACHNVENGASGRVMEKAGMACEGLQRQKLFCKGAFWDIRLYAILREDFEGTL